MTIIPNKLTSKCTYTSMYLKIYQLVLLSHTKTSNLVQLLHYNVIIYLKKKMYSIN